MPKKYIFISFVYGIFIFWISVQPITTETPELFPYQDKVIHMLLYTLLAMIIATGLTRADKMYKKKTICLYSLSIPFMYGIFIEICQIFVPTRSFEMLDIFANLCGAIIGSAIVITIATLHKKWIMRPNRLSEIET